ncbi:MAG: hypothetical protein IT162_06435 [Bryobacterales bacterium]|nr:hypothetical protein [Bryobacterales bacterium]
MILKASLQPKTGAAQPAEFELDFGRSTWKTRAGTWPGVLGSNLGRLERKSWGVTWLQDGAGFLKRTAVVLHGAPENEGDTAHKTGAGLVCEPSNQTLKDCKVRWEVLRSTLAVGASSSTGGAGLTPIRQRMMAGIADCLRVGTRALKVGEFTLGSAATATAAPGSGKKPSACGEFPGRVFRRVPVKEHVRGCFKIDVPYRNQPEKVYKDIQLTSAIVAWEDLAKEIDRKFNPERKTWIPYQTNRLPKPGDVYVLAVAVDRVEFRHVGVVFKPGDEEWITADGGQGNGWQSGYVRRRFRKSDGWIDGEAGDPAYVSGWVDVDNLLAALRPHYPELFPKEI